MLWIAKSMVVSLGLAATAFVWSTQADELLERTQAMQREAQRLAANGNHEQAKAIEREVLALVDKAIQLKREANDESVRDQDQGIHELERILERLQDEERELRSREGDSARTRSVARKVETVRAELERVAAERERLTDGSREDSIQRLEHILIAVDHLHKAGLHELAEQAAHQAEEIERRLQLRTKQQDDRLVHEILQQLNAMQAEIQDLRRSVQQLHERR